MKIKPLLIVLLFILTGCSQIQETPAAKDDRPQNLEEFYSQEINWEECGRAECASLMVPLNYQDEFVQVDGTPDSRKELQLLIQAQKDMATACQIKNPDLWA